MRTESLPPIFCPTCNPHTAHEEIYPTWVRKAPCMIECESCGNTWHSLTDLDPICQTPEFRNIKYHIGSILMAELKVNNGGIECNPATHKIAKYLYALLQSGSLKENS